MRSNVNPVVGNASLLKELNRSLILNNIRQREPISRADLVVLTGLGLPTVLRNVNALLEEGYIQEIGKGATASGRKPIMLTINPTAAHIVGIRIGRQLGIILTDFKGSIVDEHLEVANYEGGPEAIASRSYEIVSEILERNRLEYKDVAGIGVATPGMDYKTGDSEQKKPLAGWESADAGVCFFKKFEGNLVVAEFVTICGAIGEQWFGKTAQSKDSVYIYVDTGVGAGVIVDGKVFRGKDGFAGHIGHATIDYNGERCYCGSRGCLETYASSTYIVQRVRKRLELSGKSTVADLAGGDVSKISFNHVATAAFSGDQLCAYTLKEAGRALGIGIANAINTLNPDTIVLGGEVCWSCPLVVENAIAVARENTFSNQARKVEIAVSDIKYYSEAKGAVALVMNEIYKSPQL